MIEILVIDITLNSLKWKQIFHCLLVNILNTLPLAGMEDISYKLSCDICDNMQYVDFHRR